MGMARIENHGAIERRRVAQRILTEVLLRAYDGLSDRRLFGVLIIVNPPLKRWITRYFANDTLGKRCSQSSGTTVIRFTAVRDSG
jgi:hypothetical protein